MLTLNSDETITLEIVVMVAFDYGIMVSADRDVTVPYDRV